MTLQRLNVFVDADHAKRLAQAAALRGVSKSKLLAAAVASVLSPDSGDQREAAIVRRLDRLTQQFNKLEQDQNIVIETLALFIRYYLSVTAAVPESQQPAARAIGHARFGQFVEQLAKHLQAGRSLARELHEEIYPEQRDFFGFSDQDPAAKTRTDA